ncbi:MAG: hypothetical protein HOV87_27075 [Catenulispora sp.]|nr:hypothetical protein [Catenulispora sp.]
MNISRRSTLIQAGAALAIGGIGLAAVVYWSQSATEKSDSCKPASKAAEDVTGSVLCKALRDADLPKLLGIPGARTAFGGAMAQPVQGGEPSIHVAYVAGQYTVIVATHKPGSVKETEKLAGHAATLVTGTSSGKELYNLAVDYDAAGTGFYTVDVLMTDGTPMTKDTAAQFERTVAAKVLPTLPEWRS